MVGHSAWRSWFWNIFLSVGLLLFAGILIGIAVARLRVGGAATGVGIGFGLLAVVFLAGTVRALLLGVSTGPEGMVVRALGRTTKIAWDRVESIGTGPLTSGAASVANAAAPVVVWTRASDGKTRRTELSVLGGYGLVGKGPTLAQRATADLNQRLAQWRAMK